MSGEELGFKAEVQQLLDLMIHSVYSDREVFVRELVSNAADALDKARFMALTRSDLAPIQGEEAGIRITVDAEAGTVVIEDDGVGMTHDEAVKNLGTIAHSGTKAFMQGLEEGVDSPTLIGQFGIGFYSAFMVASEVTVETRSALADEAPVTWKSSGAGTFTIEEGTREHRGTRIEIALRVDAREFADEGKLSSIIRKHSNFLPWPIHVGEEQANSGKALWAENPSSVSEEDAHQFYKSMAFDWQDPALTVHLLVDSPIQYSAMLFVPAGRPHDLFTPEADRGPRLYARRVMITEHARDLLPEWLRFVRGVVDSEDIPLNVSREMLQRTPVLRKIRDALTKRIIKELGKLAKSDAVKFAEVWRSFGLLLKEGYYHSGSDLRERLLPLLRFNALSHDDGDALLSLDDYKAAMPDGQDAIWYITASSRAVALDSPSLEAFRARGWDVLLLTDPVDEWLTSMLTEFDELPLKSVTRGDLELEDEVDEEETEPEAKADLSGLGPYMHELFADAVAEVRASSRLTDSACVLVDADDGISSNLQRLLRQANQDAPAAKRVLELNPKHPLIKSMAELHSRGQQDKLAPLAQLLLDDARLMDGSLEEPTAMGRRLQELLETVATQALEG
jgi:molecular chaperone HtpG